MQMASQFYPGIYQFFLQLAQHLGAKLSKLKNIQIKDQYLDTPEKFFRISS